MDGPSGRIPLQNQNAGTFRIFWIFLHNRSRGDSGQDISDEYGFICQFVIPVIRNPDIFTLDQLKNVLKRLTHN